MREDTGLRRRRDDDVVERLSSWMERHEDWANDWTARMEERVRTVEGRADLLDGRAGNDGGIIGTLGEVRGELRSANKRLEAALAELAVVKARTEKIDKIDGQTEPPPEKSRQEKLLDFLVKVVLPIALVVIPVVGGIIVAYLQLKGQVAQLGSHP